MRENDYLLEILNSEVEELYYKIINTLDENTLRLFDRYVSSNSKIELIKRPGLEPGLSL